MKSMDVLPAIAPANSVAPLMSAGQTPEPSQPALNSTVTLVTASDPSPGNRSPKQTPKLGSAKPPVDSTTRRGQ